MFASRGIIQTNQKVNKSPELEYRAFGPMSVTSSMVGPPSWLPSPNSWIWLLVFELLLVFVYYLSTKINEYFVDIGSPASASFIIRDFSPLLRSLERSGPGNSSVFLEIGFISYEYHGYMF